MRQPPSEAATRSVGVGVAASSQKQERGREAVGLPGWTSNERLVRAGRPPPTSKRLKCSLFIGH
jgi:hypothetical protein